MSYIRDLKTDSHWSIIHPSDYLTYPPTHLSICPSIHLSIRSLPIYPPIITSPPIYPSHI